MDRLVSVHRRAVRRRDHHHRQGDPGRAAAARARHRAARALLCGAGARPQFRDSVRRPRRVQARPARNPVRRAEPDLHHQGQHAAAGRRHSLLPGDRPEARILRLLQLPGRDHAARADDAAQRDRPDGARPHVRGARPHQRARRRGARPGGGELGRQGAALRDQGPDAAEGDPARDAGADHRRAREARRHRDLRGQAAGADQSRRTARAPRRSPSPKARSRRRSTRRRATRRRFSPSPRRMRGPSSRSPKRPMRRAESTR